VYNLRYHIASLVAVFLALSLGLVLGGLVVRQGGFDKQQSAIVSGLQKDFNSIKKQNASLKSDLAFERGYSSQMTDAWIAGRLQGCTVVVITSGAKSEGADAAVSAVKAAGGSAAVVTMLEPGFGLKKSAVANAVRSVVGSSADLKTAVASTLASEWTQPDAGRPLTEALVNAGAIKVTGLRSSAAATQTVDIAAFDHKPDELALDVAQAYAGAGLFALGAQTPTNDSGVAAAAAARKLSAFETLGTSAGRFTLVALFTGAAQGFYSDSPNATAAYPPVPKP
jgi:hypothetical protein